MFNGIHKFYRNRELMRYLKPNMFTKFPLHFPNYRLKGKKKELFTNIIKYFMVNNENDYNKQICFKFENIFKNVHRYTLLFEIDVSYRLYWYTIQSD